MKNIFKCKWKPIEVFILLCLINLLNYIDRGIIPGAPDDFGYFIVKTLHIIPSKESIYIGILASSFIGSYSICSILFGYMIHFYKPFQLAGISLFIWSFAILLCGLSSYFNNFYLLLFGRIVTGIGEASFQCIAPPFIDDYAPNGMKSLWLGIFYAAISVGTAIGYVYGAFVSKSKFGWKWCFYFESICMIPLALACLTIPFENKKKTKKYKNQNQNDLEITLLLPVTKDTKAQSSKKDEHSIKEDHVPTIQSEIWIILSQKKFLFISFGYAAYTFTLSGLSVFGPLFLLGFNIFQEQIKASTIFGFIIVIAGTLGTPLGGIVLDYILENKIKSMNIANKIIDEKTVQLEHLLKDKITLEFMVKIICIGNLLFLLAWISLNTKYLFLLCIFLSLFFLLSINSSVALALLDSVPTENRSMALAINTMIIHLFGDVPSPILIGKIKDILAPDCGSISTKDGKIILNPDCRIKDQYGLSLTLLFPIVWLGWAVLLWSIALNLSKKNYNSRKS